MRVSFDSNILAYVAGVRRSPSDLEKIEASRSLMEQLRNRASFVTPAQVLGELFNVMLKGGAARDVSRSVISDLTSTHLIAYADQATFAAAFDLAVDQKLQIWDSLILSTAAQAGCTLLLSEDIQDGFTTRGVTIANPFAKRLQPALARLLA